MDIQKVYDLIKRSQPERARLYVSHSYKDYNHHQKLVFYSELNALLYSHFLHKYDVDLTSTFDLNRRLLLAEGSDKSQIVMNYSCAYMNEVVHGRHAQIEMAKRYISEHLGDKISLSDVANEIHISKNYLCKLFSDETGKTFCDYINNLRVEKAKKLIVTTDMPLEMIGQICGYHSQTHFSTTFKKYTGYSPLQYRQSILL